jgi:hypothetical protein
MAYKTVRLCVGVHPKRYRKGFIHEVNTRLHNTRQKISEHKRKDYVLKLEKNLYGQKQAVRVCFLPFKNNLIKLGFKPSEHDECVFYHVIFIVYTGDTILLGPNKEEIDNLINYWQRHSRLKTKER